MRKGWWTPLLFGLVTICCIKSVAQGTSALPVSLIMQANPAGTNKVEVSWTVLAKLGTDYFDIERSRDGMNWYSITIVKPDTAAAVPCTYKAFDLFPVKGANFYRIRMRDISGRITFTPIKTVRMTTHCNATVYPNPSSDRINILLGQIAENDWHITLTTITGQPVLYKKYYKNISTVSLAVSNFETGIYVLEITDGNSKQQKRIMINHN